MNTVKHIVLLLFILQLLFCSSCVNKTGNRLKVSENGHYLVYSDGTLYWIGDTGWAIFQKLKREEVDKYLDNRKEKGFTVIQAVLFWYPHGGGEPLGPMNESNAYGFRPFAGERNKPNTAEPLLVEGGTPINPNDYWDYIDYVIDTATKRGFELVLLPCWGNAYINNRMKYAEVMFSEDKARKYGEFLGGRYKDNKHIIWCLGGDVDPVNFADKDQRSVYRAMGEGIGWGTSGNKELKWNIPHKDWDKSLITFHSVTIPEAGVNGQEGGSSSI